MLKAWGLVHILLKENPFSTSLQSIFLYISVHPHIQRLAACLFDSCISTPSSPKPRRSSFVLSSQLALSRPVLFAFRFSGDSTWALALPFLGRGDKFLYTPYSLQTTSLLLHAPCKAWLCWSNMALPAYAQLALIGEPQILLEGTQRDSTRVPFLSYNRLFLLNCSVVALSLLNVKDRLIENVLISSDYH